MVESRMYQKLGSKVAHHSQKRINAIPMEEFDGERMGESIGDEGVGEGDGDGSP